MSFIIYAPASILFVMTPPRAGPAAVLTAKLVILAVSIVGAVALATGWVSI